MPRRIHDLTFVPSPEPAALRAELRKVEATSPADWHSAADHFESGIVRNVLRATLKAVAVFVAGNIVMVVLAGLGAKKVIEERVALGAAVIVWLLTILSCLYVGVRSYMRSVRRPDRKSMEVARLTQAIADIERVESMEKDVWEAEQARRERAYREIAKTLQAGVQVPDELEQIAGSILALRHPDAIPRGAIAAVVPALRHGEVVLADYAATLHRIEDTGYDLRAAVQGDFASAGTRVGVRGEHWDWVRARPPSGSRGRSAAH